MKKNLIVALSLFLFAGCVSYQKWVKTDAICKFDQTVHQNEFRLNLEDLMLDNNTWRFENQYIKREVFLLGDSSAYMDVTYYKNSGIEKILTYSKSKHLLESSFMYLNLFIGNLTKYDNNGHIIKVIDYRQKDNYPICFREAVSIVNRIKPRGTFINNIERSYLLRNKDTIYTWKVHVTNWLEEEGYYKNGKKKSFLYLIDAKTGRKIERKETIITTF